MATRLYPRTKDKKIIAQLAGIKGDASSAWKSYKEIRRVEKAFGALAAGVGEPFGCGEFDEASYDLYVLRSESEAGPLFRFDLSGWGRIAVSSEWLESRGFVSYGDATKDPEVVEEILRAQGVELPRDVKTESLEGLYWV